MELFQTGCTVSEADEQAQPWGQDPQSRSLSVPSATKTIIVVDYLSFLFYMGLYTVIRTYKHDCFGMFW